MAAIEQYDENGNPIQNPDPRQFATDTNRWSYHLANDPYGGAAGAWAKQYYDNPNIDPNAAIGQQVSAFRSQYGDAAPEDDAGVIGMIASGQKPSSPTQQWNAGSSSGATPTQPDPRSTELYNMLLQRATQGTAVDRANPAVRGQADAYAANEERARRNYIGDIAERAGPLANIRGEERIAAERSGQRTGAFEAELIGREIQSRRQEIAQALQGMQGILSADQQVGLQRELAALDNAIRQQQLQQSARGQDLGYDQFLRELALREWEAGNSDFYRRSGI